MFEGKLKKQIHKISNAHLRGGDSTRESLLKMIVDEAKKEFPLSEEDFRNNLAWKKKHKISDLQKDLQRIRGWLEEQFGND